MVTRGLLALVSGPAPIGGTSTLVVASSDISRPLERR